MANDGRAQPSERCSLAWSVEASLRWAQGQLAQTSEPALAAKMLLAHVLESTVSELFVHPERFLTADQEAAYRGLVARRMCHEPVAYLVGHRGFLDIDLALDERVLIPRPETELLVEQALEVAQRWARPRIADVGTGSGAIAVPLALHLPDASIYALDCSDGALEVARHNAARYGVVRRIVFVRGDLLAPLQAPVHLIVANLPYVSEDEYAALAPDIRLYEPRQALLSGVDGLDAIRRLLKTACPYLVDDGVLLLEIGAGQGQAVAERAVHHFPNAHVSLLTDYSGRDRVVRIDLDPDGT